MSATIEAIELSPLTLEETRAEIARDGVAGLAEKLGRKAKGNPLNAMIAWDFTAPDPATGPLAGIPVAVKDNTDALPFPTTGGSPALRDNMPPTDAPAVARLKAAGAWVPAKLNMHELAFGVTSDNAAFGPVINPFDPDRTAGGSSGGSGAAVALGLVPAALGSDTGASVRIPASFCGIAGLRPSTGRYPDGGVLNISWTRDTLGILANRVADIAELDAVIVPGDASLPGIRERPLRLGLPADALPGYSEAVETHFRAALAQLEKAGTAEIIPIPALNYREVMEETDAVYAMTEAYEFWQEFCADRLGVRFDDFRARLGSPDVIATFAQMADTARSSAPVYRAWQRYKRAALQARLGAHYPAHGIDMIVAPTSPVQPPRRQDYSTISIAGETLPTLPVVTQNTQIATIAGVPSLTLPAGFDADGLPVGMMLEAPIGCDRHLLAMGCRIEAALTAG